MKYRTIGNTGVEVSEICWGTDMLGGLVSLQEAEQIIQTLRHHGVNFLDTADAYQHGKSERLLGKLIQDDRNRWILATKTGNPRSSKDKGPFLTRDRILKGIQASLKRLGTDYVDFYYLHSNDPNTLLIESLRAMGEILTSGIVKFWGFSNYYAWQIAEIIRICDHEGIPRPVVAQTHYNILKRDAEREYLPACENFGIEVICYAPLARGVLSGKYLLDAPPPKQSRQNLESTFTMKSEYHPESLKLAGKIKQHAESRKIGPVQFAILWILQNMTVKSIVSGPRNVEQLLGYLKAFEYSFTEEDERFVDSLNPAGQQIPANHVNHFLPVMGRRL